MTEIVVHTPAEFGQAIRARRRALGWTQTQLAAAAGVGRRWIIDLEAGKVTASLGLVMRTLAALSLEVALGPVERAESSVLDEVLGDLGGSE